ncbi:MAG: ribonuclease H family protein [Acetatifactor sp.]|nr:ribonuclease H family protein [Acetatifactor sp.]
MAAKKYYAVKKGKITGVFENWAECKASVDGFPNAEYKGFATLGEAQEYLGIALKDAPRGYETIPGRLLAYVDGSYDDSLPKYAFGCVFLLEGGEIRLACGNGDNPQSLKHRNVTGEMLGAMYAVRTAMMNGYQAVEICYDYEGIEKWVTGSWRSKTELTQKYAASMREWGKSIQIFYTKVAAHSNVEYNELADQMAKRGLREANGVPKVMRLEELELYGEQ